MIILFQIKINSYNQYDIEIVSLYLKIYIAYELLMGFCLQTSVSLKNISIFLTPFEKAFRKLLISSANLFRIGKQHCGITFGPFMKLIN